MLHHSNIVHRILAPITSYPNNGELNSKPILSETNVLVDLFEVFVIAAMSIPPQRSKVPGSAYQTKYRHCAGFSQSLGQRLAHGYLTRCETAIVATIGAIVHVTRRS